MARVRFQYAEAIETKKIDHTIEKINPGVATSKAGLVALWEKANKKLLNILEKTDPNELEKVRINWQHWGVDEMNIHDHLNALMDHETLHNGQMIVYLRTANLKFPKSWESWGL